MEFQFDNIIDLKNTGSMKWDVKPKELPMWVADMELADFLHRGCAWYLQYCPEDDHSGRKSIVI